MERTSQKAESSVGAGGIRPFSEETHGYEVDTVDSIDREVKRLDEELEAERDARVRLAAEYQNYRRRTEREKAEAAEQGKRELLSQLLSIADDFDLALEGLSESPTAVGEGVGMIRKRFGEILEANGVSAFISEGEKFDPERHEAFDVVAADDGESGTVHADLRRGYFLNGKLLRPALVVVKQ